MKDVLTISASSYSPKTSRVVRSVPLRIVGSSGYKIKTGRIHLIQRPTGNDCQLAPEVGQADFGNVNVVHEDSTLCCLDKPEKRKGKCTLA